MGFLKPLFKKVYYKLALPFRKQITANIVTLAPNDLLHGRTAVITGCTSGIGLAISKAFLNAGASVVGVGRNSSKLSSVVNDLKRVAPEGAEVYSYELDVADTNMLEGAVPEIVNLVASHKIDILVNCAGLSSVPSLSSSEQYDIVMNTNLKAVYYLSKYVAKHMIDNNIHGNILNIASSSSLRPAGGFYALSKWGVRGLTEGLAKMLIPYNIVVNGIGPGATATPFMGKNNNEQLLWPNNPSKRMTTPEEIANIAVVLTSGMGRMIVGDIVYISGGAGVITSDDIEYNFNKID